ncbi:MAG: hypothetical protein Tsb0020_17940 [Haliangiales bacterium]
MTGMRWRCPQCGAFYDAASFCPKDGARLQDSSGAGERVGQVIGDRYRIVRKIGEGGIGLVFEATHVYIHKRVALKLLRKQPAASEEAVQRLHREARATSAIGHPNIVKIEDFGVTADDSVFLAMEWLEGESLEARVERGPLSLDDALVVVEQVCRGLDAAHQTGVIHRDLKPDNIFLVPTDDGEQAKILDFGLAKLEAAGDPKLTRTGTFVGTPYYIAPEQAAGAEVDSRCDIYALGVILYELTTGTLPFTADSAMGIINQHLGVEPEPPRERAPARGIPASLDALIVRCLAKAPDERFPTARALGEALEAIRAELRDHSGAARSAEGGLSPTELGLAATLAQPLAAGARVELPASSRRRPAGDPSAPPESAGTARMPGAGERSGGWRRGRAAKLSLGIIAALIAGVASYWGVRQLGDSGAPAPVGVVGDAGAADASADAVGARSDAGGRDGGADGAVVARPDERARDGGAGSADAGSRDAGAIVAPDAGGRDAGADAEQHAGGESWTFERVTRLTDYTVTVTPAVVQPNQSAHLAVRLTAALDRLGVPLKAGRVRANMRFVHFSDHDKVTETTAKISRKGALDVDIALPRPGKYHVELDFMRARRRLGRTQFDICVGADPRREDSRVCPGLNRAERRR